ncbi:hypothetical protein D3C87_1228130 [compost metagenome]
MPETAWFKLCGQCRCFGNSPVSNGALSQSFQFLCGGDADVWSFVVVGPPLYGKLLRLLNAFDDMLVEPFISDGAIIAFDIRILSWPARLDVRQGDVLGCSQFHPFATAAFWAIIDSDHKRLTAPYYDLVQTADHTLGGQ